MTCIVRGCDREVTYTGFHTTEGDIPFCTHHFIRSGSMRSGVVTQRTVDAMAERDADVDR